MFDLFVCDDYEEKKKKNQERKTSCKLMLNVNSSNILVVHLMPNKQANNQWWWWICVACFSSCCFVVVVQTKWMFLFKMLTNHHQQKHRFVHRFGNDNFQKKNDKISIFSHWQTEWLWFGFSDGETFISQFVSQWMDVYFRYLYDSSFPFPQPSHGIIGLWFSSLFLNFFFKKNMSSIFH